MNEPPLDRQRVVGKLEDPGRAEGERVHLLPDIDPRPDRRRKHDRVGWLESRDGWHLGSGAALTPHLLARVKDVQRRGLTAERDQPVDPDRWDGRNRCVEGDDPAEAVADDGDRPLSRPPAWPRRGRSVGEHQCVGKDLLDCRSMGHVEKDVREAGLRSRQDVSPPLLRGVAGLVLPGAVGEVIDEVDQPVPDVDRGNQAR